MKTRRLLRRMNCAEGRWRYALILWFVLALSLFVVGLAFLATGAVYGKRGLWLFATGALSLFVAVPTLAVFIWYVFCNTKETRDDFRISRDDGRFVIGHPTAYEGPLSVIDASRSVSEAELRSDYPMGPLLIMTLPKPRKSNERLANIPTGDTPRSSLNSTPDFLAKRHTISKNLPPLASEETLSPSLKSSVVSLDNAV